MNNRCMNTVPIYCNCFRCSTVKIPVCMYCFIITNYNNLLLAHLDLTNKLNGILWKFCYHYMLWMMNVDAPINQPYREIMELLANLIASTEPSLYLLRMNTNVFLCALVFVHTSACLSMYVFILYVCGV